jgi:hypothetical protein
MIPNITKGADFQGLIDYLVENRDHELLDLRGVSSVELAAGEMAAVAALSSRAKVKLLHLSLSAAHEDGALPDAKWLEAVERHERAFGLTGHQRVVVRHKDKTHDHVHVFWCTISLETGQTPPKRWFLKKGFAIDEVGPQALTDEQVGRVPPAHRARHTYDFFLLRRAQHLCRQIERDFNLRRLRSPQEAAQARLAGEERTPTIGQQKRAERTGSAPLIDRADEIRAALDQPDWPSKRSALSRIGLDLEPVFRTTKKGEELRGLVIFDQTDPGNRMKASQLDTPTRKYGWRKLEERHAAGTLSLGAWWPNRAPSPFTDAEGAPRPADRLKVGYDLVLQQHRMLEEEKRREMKRLRAEEKQKLATARRALMRKRRSRAAELNVTERRAFYASFDRLVRGPALASIADQYKLTMRPYVRSRQPSWTEFLRASADAGDRQAAQLIAAALVRQEPARAPSQVQQAEQSRDVLSAFPSWASQPMVQRSDEQALTPEQLSDAYVARRQRGGR